MRPVRRVVLHASGSFASLNEIEINHKQRGLKQIGFHYVIHSNGLLERGRKLSEAGAHCLGYNADSIAICLCGDGHVTGEQWVKTKRLVKKLGRRFPQAELVRVGELDPWSEDPLRLDMSVMKQETGL